MNRMSGAPSLRRRIRWFRISLREMVLLVTACSCLLAFLFSPAHRQRRAVDAVRALGGNVDYKGRSGEGVRQSDSSWQRWVLANRVGRIDAIDLSNTSITDSDLLRLAPLAETTVLDLSQTQITGDGLQVLRSMPSIRKLNLSYTGVRDASLVHLRGSETLKELDLSHTQVTRPELAELGSLPRLRCLNLSGTGTGDASLAQLAGKESLEELRLDGTNVTDAGLIHLQECENLRFLSVNNTQVSIVGLSRLSELGQLQSVLVKNMFLTLKEVSETAKLITN